MCDSNFFKYKLKISEIICNILDKTISEVCNEMDCVIIVNAINLYSLPFLLGNAHPKPLDIQEKTIHKGLLAGTIATRYPWDKRLKDIQYKPIDNTIFPLKNGKCSYYNLYYKDKLVIADIDIVAIAKRHRNSKIIFEPQLGYIDIFNVPIIKRINSLFKRKIATIFNKELSCDIVQHGPLNDYSKIQKKDLNFPMNIYSPNCRKSSVPDCQNFEINFNTFIKEIFGIKAIGYCLKLNKNWL